jgi:predicted RNA polymerase sigma factor
VLYLMFNEGYIATTGPDLQRPELTGQALSLVRRLHERLPDSGETAGLLALMLLTDSRRSARTGPDGELIPLTEQDRSLWDSAAIAEGTALISTALATSSLGPYQLQAAIAAVHAESPSVQDTDWPQVLALYTLLERLAPNPVTTLNRAVALGMVNGPGAALAVVSELEAGVLAGSHRLLAVRAHLLERAGQPSAAAAAYQEAARLTGSLPEQRFLLGGAPSCAY